MTGFDSLIFSRIFPLSFLEKSVQGEIEEGERATERREREGDREEGERERTREREGERERGNSERSRKTNLGWA